MHFLKFNKSIILGTIFNDYDFEIILRKTIKNFLQLLSEFGDIFFFIIGWYDDWHKFFQMSPDFIL